MKKFTLYWIGLLGVVILSGCSQQILLFNGQDLDGWDAYLKDEKVDPADVWSINNGVIHCNGRPNGYLRTKADYSNYKLHVEWRWVGEPTNSGVLLHTTGENKLWPQSIEAQLMHQNAGDFVTIQTGSAITVNGKRHTPSSERFYKIIAKQHDSSENPPGEWNSYDIVCKEDTIQLTVNGVLQNTATESTLTSGAICLQSEGSPIEFRNITITPLK
jgi:hypothetical protein